MFFDNVDTDLKVILRKSEDEEDPEDLALAEAWENLMYDYGEKSDGDEQEDAGGNYLGSASGRALPAPVSSNDNTNNNRGMYNIFTQCGLYTYYLSQHIKSQLSSLR